MRRTRSRTTRLLLAGLVVLTAALGFRPDVAAPAWLQAQAPAEWYGRCLVPGSDEQCTIWSGDATFVSDGDTLYVDVDGDGTPRREHVRITGINAMEQSVYSRDPAKRVGDCHALEATARLEQLIGKSRGRVRLIAQDPASRAGNRPRRALAVKLNGRWRDVSRRLLSEGHALWLPNRKEWVWNRDYSVLAQRAQKKGVGLWSPQYCGLGFSEASPLQLWVNSDADGADSANTGGEWIRVRNLDPVNTVPLGGWWVRDSQLRRYTFPEWAALPPGETVTVRVGQGLDSFTELFWGLRATAFENASSGFRQMGDGAYLFDPEGDLRAAMQYPCRVECADPNAGLVTLDAEWRGREHVTLRNTAPYPVDLTTYRLESPPYSYAFTGDSVLQPGEELRIDVEGDPATDTRLQRSWGETGPILDGGGDRLRLSTYQDIDIACFAYGRRSC